MSTFLTNRPTKQLIPTKNVLQIPIAALSFANQIKTIVDWASRSESKMVCVANVHMLMEAYWNCEFAKVLNDADLRTPDGMPLVWMMRCLGAIDQERVAGMDIFQAVCRQAERSNLSVFFVGSEPRILARMRDRLLRDFPDLHVAGMESLPFKPLPITVDRNLVKTIKKSGAKIVFVSLGCPKQEYWMHRYRDEIRAVTIGLGGVFPIYAGLQTRAPKWMRLAGLEWAYRLFQEPQRLWWRYLKTIPTFLCLASWQLMGFQK